MSHALGTHIGGVDSIEAIRLRCVCSADDDCWHFRTARGRPMPTDKVHRVWVHGRGILSVGRAVWLLSTGQTPKAKHAVYRMCDSYDCANPVHLKCGPRRQYLRLMAQREVGLSDARLAALAVSRERRRVVSAELRSWIADSSQPATDLSDALGVSRGRISAIRADMRKRVASVFHLAQPANCRTAASSIQTNPARAAQSLGIA